MHVCKGGQISEVGAKFPRKFGPPGAIFPRKFGPGGPNFPVTPDKKIHTLDYFALSQEFCPFWTENKRPFSFGK